MNDLRAQSRGPKAHINRADHATTAAVGRGQERPRVSSFAGLRDALRETLVLVEPEARTARIDEGLARRRGSSSTTMGYVWGAIVSTRRPRRTCRWSSVACLRSPRGGAGPPPEVSRPRRAGGSTARGRHRAAVTAGGDRVGKERWWWRAAMRPSSWPRQEAPARRSRRRPRSVTFHQGLDLPDKSTRMVALVEAMGRRGLLAGRLTAEGRARLAKRTVTLMVRGGLRCRLMGGSTCGQRHADRYGDGRAPRYLPVRSARCQPAERSATTRRRRMSWRSRR